MSSTTSLLILALAILSMTHTILGADNDSMLGNETTTLSTITHVPLSSESPTNSSSTTQAPKTTSTTVSPSTTTVMPSTTPSPHKDHMWTVRDPKTGFICIIADMKIQLDIPYTNSSDKVVMAHVKVPGNATGSGFCDISDPSANQTLSLQWGNATSPSKINFTFSSNTTSKQFWLESIAAVVVVDDNNFPGIKPTVRQVKLVNGTRHFVTPMSKSYSCPSLLNIPGLLTPEVINHTGYFTLDHFQLEAFKNSSTNGFSTAIYCESDNTPDLVPILVGCTLVGLVVIVLAVYLWGRRRSQQRGYLSM